MKCLGFELEYSSSSRLGGGNEYWSISVNRWGSNQGHYWDAELYKVGTDGWSRNVCRSVGDTPEKAIEQLELDVMDLTNALAKQFTLLS